MNLILIFVFEKCNLGTLQKEESVTINYKYIFLSILFKNVRLLNWYFKSNNINIANILFQKLEKSSSPGKFENLSNQFSSNNNRSFESMNNNSSSWLAKQQKILYIRSQHSHLPERQGIEKNFKIELVENGGEDGPFKSNQRNKSSLI